jgi:uncharacterized RDD family membrane protein YckC
MARPARYRQAWRRVAAVVLLALAVALILLEPFPKGIAVGITETHGIEAGDLPAIILLLVAAWLAFGVWFRSRLRQLHRQRQR